LQERLVWHSLDVLLEAFVFAYMGLQLRFVIDDVTGQGEPLGRLIAASLLVLIVVIGIRPAWVFVVFSSRLLFGRLPGRRHRWTAWAVAASGRTGGTTC